VFSTRRSLIASAATLALAGFAALGVAAPASAATVNDTTARIGICKATGSAKNPYIFVHTTTDNLLSGHYTADDIVPAYTYTTADGTPAMFIGQNTSSFVLTDDCVAVPVVVRYIW
jgi:hypothetical protein